VEHLVASSIGGSNSDENCVVCCKAVNALLGRMSLKEKVRVVLNQEGYFKCPNSAGASKSSSTPATPKQPKATESQMGFVVENLKQRGHARPRRVKTLKSTIASLFPAGLSDSELSALVEKLESLGKIVVSGNNVSYQL